jgi:uncharacterized protein YgiM (DUF1202 family)
MEGSRRNFLKLVGASAGVGATGVLAADSAAALTYTVETNLNAKTNFTGAQIDEAIRSVRSDSPLIGLGDAMVFTGEQESINALYIAAHAAWESAWGTSDIARYKNNLYGWGAYDSCPYECAKSFSSKDDCIDYVMAQIKDLYLTPGGQYYEGPTLLEMNENYATDNSWAEGIRDVMNSLVVHIPTGDFDLDTRVATTASALNVRNGAGTNYGVAWTAPSGSAGYVRDGPVAADGYDWYKVAFNSGVTGWAIEEYLQESPA